METNEGGFDDPGSCASSPDPDSDTSSLSPSSLSCLSFDVVGVICSFMPMVDLCHMRLIATRLKVVADCRYFPRLEVARRAALHRYESERRTFDSRTAATASSSSFSDPVLVDRLAAVRYLQSFVKPARLTRRSPLFTLVPHPSLGGTVLRWAMSSLARDILKGPLSAWGGARCDEPLFRILKRLASLYPEAVRRNQDELHRLIVECCVGMRSFVTACREVLRLAGCDSFPLPLDAGMPEGRFLATLASDTPQRRAYGDKLDRERLWRILVTGPNALRRVVVRLLLACLELDANAAFVLQLVPGSSPRLLWLYLTYFVRKNDVEAESLTRLLLSYYLCTSEERGQVTKNGVHELLQALETDLRVRRCKESLEASVADGANATVAVEEYPSFFTATPFRFVCHGCQQTIRGSHVRCLVPSKRPSTSPALDFCGTCWLSEARKFAGEEVVVRQVEE